MPKKALRRIEKTLAQLAEQQDAICAEVGTLRARVDALAAGDAPASDAPRAAGRDEVLAFLDQFRAGEALGEASTGAWLAVSDVDCVRGGLRVVQQREGMHARLLEERIKQLGGTCSFEIPDAIHSAAMADAGDAAKGDAAKVLGFVQRFGDADAALAPLHELADRLDDDPETQSLLRNIALDERATLDFFNEACALLNA